jgi:hypothetical protein
MTRSKRSADDGTQRLSRLFLHYFDAHFLADKGKVRESQAFFKEMRLATRLAVASAEAVFIPASSYFESNQCRAIVDELRELLEGGVISLVGGAENLDLFVAEKLDTAFYRAGSPQHSSYSAHRELVGSVPYTRRERSATGDIIEEWRQDVFNDRLPRLLREAAGHPIGDLERRLEFVPVELGRLAFIPEHVFEILGLSSDQWPVQSRIRSVINYSYFKSHARDLQAGVVTDLQHLGSTFALPSFGRNLSYRAMYRWLLTSNRLAKVLSCGAAGLLRLGEHPEWRQALCRASTHVGEKVLGAGDERRNELEIPGRGLEVTVLCITASPAETEAVSSYLASKLGPGELRHSSSGRSAGSGQGTHFVSEYRDPETNVVWRLGELSFQGEVEAGVAIAELLTWR